MGGVRAKAFLSSKLCPFGRTSRTTSSMTGGGDYQGHGIAPHFARGHEQIIPVDDTRAVTIGAIFGGFTGLLFQVIGYGGVAETAAVAATTVLPGFVGGIGAFFLSCFIGANVGQAIGG